MNRLTTIFLALAGVLFAPLAAAQNEAKATLYTRVEGDQVRAALVIRINPTWYLYHTDLGHPDAIGTPLTVELGGEGVTWGEVAMPEPKVKKVDEAWGKYTYNYHTDRITAYALGSLSPGADGKDVTAKLVGQTCSDAVGICIDYIDSPKSKGEGSDKYWADWPAALAAPAGDAGAASEPPVTEGHVEEPPSTASGLDPPVALGPPIRVGAGSDENVVAKLFIRVDEDEETARAIVEIDVAPHYHIYFGPTEDDLGHPEAVGEPTTLEIDGGGIEWDTTLYSAPEAHDEVYGEGVWSWVYEGRIYLAVDGYLYDDPAPEEVLATLAGQYCDANGCTPFKIELESAGEGTDAQFAAFVAAPADLAGGAQATDGSGSSDGAIPASVDSSGADGPSEGEPPLGRYLLLAVMWGLVTLLMPCTYPMIPITISFFTKQAINKDGKVLPLSIAYGAGIVLMFVILGAVFGKPVQMFANHPITQVAIGSLFLFFALVLFGVIDLRPPAFLLNMAGKASQKGGIGGVFLMGTTLVVTSFSCTAPFVGDIIARGAQGGMLRPMLGMGVFGLTMAIPFVLLSLFPARLQKMPTAGEWMHVLKVFLGFVELAAAFKFFSGADLIWNFGALPDELFLLIWMAVFFAAAMFLFGWIHLTGETQREIGPFRMVSAVATLVFSLYCGYGLLGFKMDPIMVSILPGYQAQRVAGGGFGVSASGAGVAKGPEIIKDDFERAVAVALENDQMLLVNFTGFN